MKKVWGLFITNKSSQLIVFLLINSLFILKYVPRLEINSLAIWALYFIFILAIFVFFYKYLSIASEKKIKVLYWSVLGLALIGIGAILYIVDPYTLRIDRWSALSFFWDSFLEGQYPYAAHTHLRINSFTSSFPVWLCINFPFYLMGDVGYELIFFLVITAIAIRYYFGSYRKAFFFLFLLLLSPAYWYEVGVRSDSLSNGLFAFMIILWYIKTNRTLANSFLVSILLCSAVASTRFSAIIPIALFLFQPYLHLSLKQKIIFPLSIIGIAFLFLVPFIFWDTNTWIFFRHNPFMAQTGNGNIYYLMIMIILGVFFAVRWKNTSQLFAYISIFMFVFMLGSQFVSIITAGHGNLFSDAISDISYLTLALPYCLANLTDNFDLK